MPANAEAAQRHGDDSLSMALRDLLRDVLGARVALLDYQTLKRAADYWVLRAYLAHPAQEVVVKFAGPGAALACPFERTALIHRLVAAQTDIPMPAVLAADESYRRWPWRYFIREAVPGIEWAAIRAHLSAAERAAAHAEMGRAVAALHGIRFPAFGELAAGGTLPPARSYLAALAERARRRIANPRLADLFCELLDWHAALFADVDEPCLCHEDLHPHNLLFRQDADGWHLAAILDFDKAWAGHAESDLARLALWRGMAGRGFWPAYRAAQPLAPAYRARRPFYQLLWCLEYAADTPRHLADIARVCAELGIPPVEYLAL